MQLSTRGYFRTGLLTASIFLGVSPSLHASVLGPNSALPPVNSVFFFSPTCISTVCLSDIQLSGFRTFSTTIVGGDEVTMSYVDLTASLFQNAGGVDGPFISPLRLTGEMDTTYFAKPSRFGAGTFSSEITSLDLSGSFIGSTGRQTIDLMLDPAQMSTGEITAALMSTGPEVWQLSGFFNVFTELSINGAPFVPGPVSFGSLGTPEPASYLLIGLGLAFLLTRRIIGARRIATRSVAS